MLKALMTCSNTNTHFDMLWIILIFYPKSSRLLLRGTPEIPLLDFNARTSRLCLELENDCRRRPSNARANERLFKRMKKTSEKTVSFFIRSQTICLRASNITKKFLNSLPCAALSEG